MVILGQSLAEGNEAFSQAFFVGMSKQEYYSQVRHKIGTIGDSNDKGREERIDEEYERGLRDKRRIAESKEVYEVDKIFEVYACIKRDLSGGFLTFIFYPIAGQWNGYSPWQRYPDHHELDSVEQLSQMPFYDWENKRYIPIEVNDNSANRNGRTKNCQCEQEASDDDKADSIVATNVSNTCAKCYNAVHWDVHKELYCAAYSNKPYEVYFEGKPCPKFEEIDELPGTPKKH